MIDFQKLQQLPDGMSETAELIAKLDSCFLSGFAALNAEQTAALEMLKAVFAGSPLGEKLAESVGAIGQQAFQERHFLHVAAVRVALQGAQYDGLRGHVAAVMGRDLPEEVAQSQTPSAERVPLLESGRHWLMELAIGGFARLDFNTVSAFDAALGQLQADPQMMPLAALLGGFSHELRTHLPIRSPADVPLFRWVDLWSQGMIGTLRVAQPEVETAEVSGTFYPLGIELREHEHLLSAVVWGLLEHGETAELVRITQSAYTVPAISGNERWLLLPQLAPLVTALVKGKVLTVDGMQLSAAGDLRWVGSAEMGAGYKLLDVAQRYFAAEAEASFVNWPMAPAERHPIHLAEPVYLDGYSVEGDTLQWADSTSLKMMMARLQGQEELTAETLAGTDRMWGVLRFDAGVWQVQPLAAAKGKGKPIFTGKDGAKLLQKPPKKSTVGTLQERASRLLRS